MRIRPKNWSDFQHYKGRRPPWIKLHRDLLDNYEFQCLPLASRALAPMLWLLASEDEAGWIDADEKKLVFKLRCTVDELAIGLEALVTAGFFESDKRRASSTLAARKQEPIPDKNRIDENRLEESRGCSAPSALEPTPIKVISLPTNREGEEVAVYANQISELSELYPAVDVLQQFRAMRAWLLTNRERRKTAKGMMKFANLWLSKEQDRAKPNGRPTERKETAHDRFLAGALSLIQDIEQGNGTTPANQERNGLDDHAEQIGAALLPPGFHGRPS